MEALVRFFKVPLYRELSVVAVIIIMIIAYYFRYVHFAKLSDTRLHRRWLAKLVSSTRHMMMALVIALIGLVVYDRVLMPRAAASVVHVSQKTSSQSSAKASKPKAKAQAASHKVKATKPSSSSGEVIDAASHSLTSSQYHALLVVQDYFKKNPESESAAQEYRYRDVAVGNADIQVTEIGGYRKYGKNKLKLTHVYWVYPSGQFDVKR